MMIKLWKLTLFFLLCLVVALLFNLPLTQLLPHVRLPDTVPFVPPGLFIYVTHSVDGVELATHSAVIDNVNLAATAYEHGAGAAVAADFSVFASSPVALAS